MVLVKELTDQRSGIERTVINPHKHGQLTFDKRAKAILWRNDSLFKQTLKKLAHKNPKTSTILSLTFYVKSYPKWIIDLNVKHKTVKLSEEDMEENLHDLELGKEF